MESGSLLKMVRMLPKHGNGFVSLKNEYAVVDCSGVSVRARFGTNRIKVWLRKSKAKTK